MQGLPGRKKRAVFDGPGPRHTASSPLQCPTALGTLAIMLPCRLVLFIDRVRELAPQWQWQFALITTSEIQWTEEQIHERGWPSDHIYSLDVTVHCQMRYGCFTARRVVNHHRAARFFATEARKLVDDIAAEFRPRLKSFNPHPLGNDDRI